MSNWRYSQNLVYGLIVKARDCPKIKSLLEKYQDVIDYREKGVPYVRTKSETTILVFLKSTEKEIFSAVKSDKFDSPDIRGTAFDPPQHPLFTMIEEHNDPILTDREKEALAEIELECTIFIPSEIKDKIRNEWMEGRRNNRHLDRGYPSEPDLSSAPLKYWVKWGGVSYPSE